MGISLGEGVTWDFFPSQITELQGQERKQMLSLSDILGLNLKYPSNSTFFSFLLYVLRVTFHALTTFLTSLSCLTLKSTTDQFI